MTSNIRRTNLLSNISYRAKGCVPVTTTKTNPCESHVISCVANRSFERKVCEITSFRPTLCARVCGKVVAEIRAIDVRNAVIRRDPRYCFSRRKTRTIRNPVVKTSTTRRIRAAFYHLNNAFNIMHRH